MVGPPATDRRRELKIPGTRETRSVSRYHVDVPPSIDKVSMHGGFGVLIVVDPRLSCFTVFAGFCAAPFGTVSILVRQTCADRSEDPMFEAS